MIQFDLLGLEPDPVAVGLEQLVASLPLLGENMVLVYRPELFDDPKEERQHINDVFRILHSYASQTGPLVLLIDEVDIIANAHYAPRWLRFMIQFARHFGITLIFAARRPAEIPSSIMSQATRIYTFKLELETDISKLKGFGLEFDVRRLPKYQFVEVGTNELWGPIPYDRSSSDIAKAEPQEVGSDSTQMGSDVKTGD